MKDGGIQEKRADSTAALEIIHINTSNTKEIKKEKKQNKRFENAEMSL